MASSNGKQNREPVSEQGEPDIRTGLENNEGGDNTNMGNPANVKILGSFKVEDYDMEVSVKKAGSVWHLKCGDKEVNLPEEIRNTDKLDFNEGILIYGENAYQLKERNGAFGLDIIDGAQLDQENNTSKKIDGDDCNDEKEMVSVESDMRASHKMVQLSNPERQITQSHQANNVLTSKSTDMEDNAGERKQSHEMVQLSNPARQITQSHQANNVLTSKSTDMEDNAGARKQSHENLSFSDMTTNKEMVTNENSSIPDVTTNTEVGMKAEITSSADKTNKDTASVSPPVPPRCSYSTASSTDVYENDSNSLLLEKDQHIANQSTSSKSNAGIGGSTFHKKPMPSPRQHKSIKINPSLERMNSNESEKIQTETDEEPFNKGSSTKEGIQQSKPLVCGADGFTGEENDKNNSKEAPPLPKKEKTASLAEGDDAAKKEPSPTPPPRHKGVKNNPSMGRMNSNETEKIQTETDEETFNKESNTKEGIQQSKPLVGGADGFTGAENDKNNSKETPPLPEKERSASLAKEDDVTETGSSPTPPPSQGLRQNQEKTFVAPKSEETRSERENEGKGREFEIHLLLKYWKSRDFTSDLSTTCNLDTYLRWHYVLENFQLRNKKMDSLKARNIHANVEKADEDLWVNIDLGKLEKKLLEADVSRIKDSVMTELMLDTETLVTNSFPATGINRHEAVKLMMEKSREEMGSELWVYPDKDTDVIYCVYPATRRTKVDSCIQEVTKTLKEGERILPLALVFSKLFDQDNIKLKMKREYRLTMVIDCLESENKCRVALKGTMSQVEKGWSWINTKFVDNYTVNEIGFKDVKKQETNISEEIIVEDVLSQAEFEIVSWYINVSCEKISICSTDRVILDKAIAALKRGIRKEEFPMELYESLSDVQAVREGRAILKRTDKLVQVMGTDKALAGIKQFVQELENNRQANKTAKQGQINKDNDQNQHSNVTEATISFVVDNLHVFERLCNSEELKDYADKLKVKLSTKHKDRRGFLLTGSSDGRAKVKEMLRQMVESLNQKKFSANVSRDHWTLSCGHGITVQYPINMLDANFVVSVDTVPPELAEFDREQKTLHLPEWIDGCKKETEKTETCLKKLLLFSLHKNLYKIQIALPEVHKKIAKHFTHGLFSLLSGEEFKKKPPIQLFICTDSQDMYMCLTEFCKQSKKMLSSMLHRSASVLEKHGIPTPGIEISVISGQLNGTKADVIVNTTSKDLNLSSGKVSNALLQSAGQELQSEVRRKCPNGIKFGEIVVTNGYRLQGCKFVFHGALESFSAAGSIKGLYKFVVDCLLEADRRKCKTIAFPAIGTGNLGYPQHQVAHAMFSAVRAFESKNTHLKEVLFVIYHLDEHTVKEFRKQHECNEAGLVKNCGKVRISIDYGVVTHVFTTSIIYVWERKSLHNVKLKEHALLSHVGADVQKLWTNHRSNKEIRDDPLTTPGGKLPVSCIVHVFCQNDLESLKVAIMEGLHKTNSCDSVTLFFDENIKLLSHGESLVDVFQDCVIQMSETSLCYVSMSLDNIDLVTRFQTHLTNSSASETASGRQSVVPEMGAENNKEPEDQSIDDRGDVRADDKGNDQIELWRSEQADVLTHGSMDITNNYVLVKDIPQAYTESDLEDDVKDCYPKLRYSTIFVPGMSEAIIKCKDKKGTTQLVGKESKGVRFTKFPAQSMMQFSTTIEYAVGEKTVQSLREKDIEVKVKAGKTYLTAPTKLQFKYALVILEKTKSYPDGTRQNSEGFRNSIEVTVDVWDIVETLKKKEITKLRGQGKEISYHEGYIMFSDQKGKSEDPHWTVVKSCVDSLKRMQILEVTITEQNVDKIKKWCLEIEGDQAKQCCVFVPNRTAVFLFDDSYENLQNFKHQLLIKDGQIKVTGRGKRMFNDTNPVFPAGKESEPHNSDSNILPVVEGESKSCNDSNQEDREKQRLGKKQEFNLKLQAKNLQVYATAESIKVCVYEANILKLPVDCIVNAANDTLQHGGGVARVIAVAAGSRLDKEGCDYIKKHGKIPVGKTCVTTAGNLHYDCVIHAVGPRWSDYSPHSLYDVQRCEQDLYSAITESFLAAEKRCLESIALPAISAAIFGVPEEVCVYHYAKAAIDYSKKMSPKALKEIHFIDINSNIIRSIQNMFDAFLTYKRRPDYSTDKFVRTTVKPYRPRSKSPERTEHRGRDTDTEIVYTYYKDDFRHIIETEKCRLVIQHGDIMQVKAAAIVSVEDSRGSGKGKISKLVEGKIEGRDKNSYRKSKTRLFSTDKETGDVIVTEGFNSGYQYILHAVLPHDVRNFHSVDRENTITQTLKKILETLDGRSIRSIVICLLGAGEETKEEIDVAAVAFIKTFKTYCEQRKRGQSKHLEIKLVCKQENILKWVLEKFRDYGIIQDCTERAPALPPRPAKKSENLTEDLDNRESLEDCVICMEKITKRKVLKCGHAFDKDCIKQAFKVKKVCPTCGMICGKLKGDQPDGKMKVNIETYSHCAGYEQYGRISITYTFPSGKQGPDHPNPGKQYKGITRTAYLPDNDEGNEVLEMLRLAFDRKLTFTIGTSRTTGEEGVITWNDIHHKTDPTPKTQFGYPDPAYLERVKDELTAKGITPEDIRKTH